MSFKGTTLYPKVWILKAILEFCFAKKSEYLMSGGLNTKIKYAISASYDGDKTTLVFDSGEGELCKEFKELVGKVYQDFSQNVYNINPSFVVT